MGIKFVGIKNFEIPRNQNAKDTNHKSSWVHPNPNVKYRTLIKYNN